MGEHKDKAVAVGRKNRFKKVGPSAGHNVHFVGKFKLFDKVPGSKSRIGLPGITEAEIQQAINTARLKQRLGSMEFDIVYNDTRYRFTQGMSGSCQLRVEKIQEFICL
jgi:hypothetical protein